MKCPKCQAKLLPVDGVLFCLQCGTAIEDKKPGEIGPAAEDTVDPLLQRAILDSGSRPVTFKRPNLARGGPKQPEKPAPAPLGTTQKASRTTMDTGAVSVPTLASLGLTASKTYQPVAKVSLRRMGRPAAWAGLLALWPAILAGVAALISVNLAFGAYYADKVYPGVVVNGVDFSGLALREVYPRAVAAAAGEGINVVVGNTTYHFEPDQLGISSRAARIEALVKEAGRAPVGGVVGGAITLLAREEAQALPPPNDAIIAGAIAKVAAEAEAEAAGAQPVIVAGRLLVVADQAGSKLDQSAARKALAGAVGQSASLRLQLASVTPPAASGSYAAEASAAATKLGLNLKLTVRGKVITPSAADIGAWLAFGEPGKGVVVQEARIAQYVSGIPGSFDRPAAVNALAGAVRQNQNLSYTASSRPVKVAALPAPVAARQYGYCVAPGNAELSEAAAGALADAGGWSLRGQLQFVAATTCNLRYAVVPDAQMGRYSPACTKVTTCQAGHNLLISQSAWANLPETYQGELTTYRRDLVNHLTGQWLGFEHASCSAPAAATPISEPAAVVIAGCSPNWYQVPTQTAASHRSQPF